MEIKNINIYQILISVIHNKFIKIQFSSFISIYGKTYKEGKVGMEDLRDRILKKKIVDISNKLGLY